MDFESWWKSVAAHRMTWSRRQAAEYAFQYCAERLSSLSDEAEAQLKRANQEQGKRIALEAEAKLLRTATQDNNHELKERIAELEKTAAQYDWILNNPGLTSLFLAEATNHDTYGKRTDEDIPMSRVREYIRERIADEMEQESAALGGEHGG